MAENEQKSGDRGGIVFVKSNTPTEGLANCIVAIAITEKKDKAVLRCVGAGANSQMTKGIIVAKDKLVYRRIGVTIDLNWVNVPAQEGSKNKEISAIECVLRFIR